MPGLPVGALQDKHFGIRAWSTSEVCQLRQGAVLKTAILEQDEAHSGRRFLHYQPQNASQRLPQRQLFITFVLFSSSLLSTDRQGCWLQPPSISCSAQSTL